MPLIITQQANKYWNGPALARLNRQTGVLLNQIAGNPGVSGAFICDNHGSVLAGRFAAAPERSALEQAGRWLAQILAVIELHGGKAQELELRYDGAGLMVRDIGNAFEAVRCHPDVNWSLLRMAVNVSVAPFENDAELQERLNMIAPTRADALEANPDSIAQRWLLRMAMAGGVGVQSPALANSLKPVEVMVRFATLFIEGLAEHGFDLDSQLQILDQSLKTLTAKYPMLKFARIANRTLDLSAFEAARAGFGDVVAGWSELMWELHASSVLKMGRKSAEAIYHRVYETLYRQDQQAFRSLALELAFRNIRAGGDAGQLGNSV